MVKIIDGETFKNMMLAAAAAIEEKKQEINELNVFPVPDGDTGTNMSMTLNAAAAELAKFDKPTLGKAVETASSALLRGARGNSGVITSLLFRGFGKRLKELTCATAQEFAEALMEGVNTAYKAVMKPAEGTILTVSRVAAEQAVKKAGESDEAGQVLAAALDAAKEALEKTVEQNPVLKKAGVVDAGGYGWVLILENMQASLTGDKPKSFFSFLAPKQPKTEVAAADFSQFDEGEINFAYCTEFIAAREDQKKSVDKFRRFLEGIGDCVVAVEDDEIVKVHVHTDTPDKALAEGLKFGQLLTVKIENMVQQLHRKNNEDKTPANRQIAAPERKYGFVAVAAGQGVLSVFQDLGVDSMVEGGQTMNPSTEDILNAIDRTPSEIVYVLPNNKNIIMAAEQAADLSEKLVYVLPTKMITQGVTAMLAFDPDAGPEQNRDAMIAAAQQVSTGQITYAARDSDFDGKTIKQGDFMALTEGKLLCNSPRFEDVARRMARDLCSRKSGFVTIFYGEGADAQQADMVKEIFSKEAKNAEITLIEGGQPVYSYIVSVE